MWEITLLGKPSDILYFNDLKKTLIETFNNDIIIAITFDTQLICSIAVIDKNLEILVKDFVLEFIIKIVKIEYFSNNLTILGNDKSLNTFLLSNLVLIDLYEEVMYCKKVAELSKTISIRSFIYFKLHKLIDIWKKEVKYYNKNFSGYDNDNMYLSFLKFLAVNSRTKSNLMYLEENSDNVNLLDDKRQVVKNLSKTDEIGLIACLIMFSPKKLIINCIDSLSTKVSNLISYIFEDRVSILL